jgi:site-specific recombinase XerD
MARVKLTAGRVANLTGQFCVQLNSLRIKENFASMKMNEVSRKQLQLFHNRLLEDGLKPASADHYLKLMRRAWNLAVEWQVLESSPLTRLTLFLPDNRIEHYLSPADLEKLVDVLRTEPKRTFRV